MVSVLYSARKRLFLTLTLLFAFGLCGLAFHFFWFGYRQCHPPRTLVTAAEATRARETLPGLIDVSFMAADGVTLRGWYAPPRNGLVLILVHGLMGNRASLLPEAEVFARHGYGLLLFDSRAHGSSGGSIATWGSTEAVDIAEAVRFVRARPRVERVALLGFSVGASAVARAAANDAHLVAVILYATWPSLRKEMRYKEPHGWLAVQLVLLGFRYSGVQVDQVRPEADLPLISPRPLLMVSGGRDTDTPPSVMDDLFALASGAKAFWRVPNAIHGGYFQTDPAGYEERVVGFLDRVSASSR